MIVAAAQMGFYEVAAQLLLGLVLVLMLGESRVIRTDGHELGDWRLTAVLGICAAAVLLLGEMAALAALERGHDSFLLQGATSIALVYGFGFVLAQATRLILLGRADRISPGRKEALGRLYMAVVTVGLIVSFAMLLPGVFLSGFGL